MADGRTKAEHNNRVEDLLGAVVPLRAREVPSAPPAADLGNVVAFAPRKRGGPSAPAIACSTGERPAPAALVSYKRWKSALLIAGSLAVHGGLLAAFLREPSPHASIGLEVISVELVLGANQAAGLALAPTPSESELSAPASPKEEKPDAERPETARSDSEPTKPLPVEEPTEQKKPEPPTASQPLQAEIPPEPVENPELAVDPKPAEKPVNMVALPTEPREVKEPQNPKPDAKPAAQKKPRENGKSSRDRATPASTPSAASNSIGRGRSDADTNYRGIVSAHLARYKQFPSDARSRGDQGTASVTFSLDGGGRVTSVRLARGSGVASIDQETQAMVRRASPFPAPPSGRGLSFTVPVQFYLR